MSKIETATTEIKAKDIIVSIISVSALWALAYVGCLIDSISRGSL
jgi:hypothetical protein